MSQTIRCGLHCRPLVCGAPSTIVSPEQQPYLRTTDRTYLCPLGSGRRCLSSCGCWHLLTSVSSFVALVCPRSTDMVSHTSRVSVSCPPDVQPSRLRRVSDVTCKIKHCGLTVPYVVCLRATVENFILVHVSVVVRTRELSSPAAICRDANVGLSDSRCLDISL